ncbi:ketopantoate reductase [Staphylococcus epidermidis]
MKIAIAGSGALGSGFGAKLFQHGYDVTLIDNWEPKLLQYNRTVYISILMVKRIISGYLCID